MFKLTNDSLAAADQETIISTAAYLDIPNGASIPSSHRWFQTYLEWLAVPNTPDPAESALEISDRLRAERILELKNEGLARIQVELPGINSFDTLELVREQWLSLAPASRNATVTFQSVIDIYQAARDGVIVLNAANDAAIAAYDVLTDPSWPV